MKIRTGFVTYSCSSFVIAQRMELSGKQKKALANYVEKMIFKRDILIGTNEADYEIFTAEADGCRRTVGFGGNSYRLAELYCALWNAIEAADSEDSEEG